MNEYFTAGVILSIGAVLLVLAFVYLDNGGVDYTEENTWEWDDYKEAPDGVLGVSGPLEIVTVDGVTYIHANDTGKGEIVYEKGKKTHILIEPAKADLIIMNGQSNSAYYDTSATVPDPSEAVAPSIGTSFYFGTPDRMPYLANDDPEGMKIYGFVDEAGTLRVGDKGPAFCKTYTDATGKKAVWLSLGIPAKRLSTWDRPNGTAWVQNMKVWDAFEEALKDVPIEIDHTYMLWAQGESDYLHNTGQAAYVSRFKSLWSAAQAEWGAEQCFLIDGRTAQVGWVNDAFRTLAEEPTIHVAVQAPLIDSFSIDNGLMHADDLHYTQRGDNAVGDGCARYVTNWLGKYAGQAPIYLIQAHTATVVNGSVALPTTATTYSTDGALGMVLAEFEGTVDTSVAGTTVIEGTATVSPGRVLPHAPPALAIIEVIEGITVDGVIYTVAETTATVAGYTGSPVNVTIPATVSKAGITWTVTAVGNSAFEGCATLKTLDLGSVSGVGSSAFYNCTALESVTAPSVLRVGANGFRGCSALTAIDLPVATTLLSYSFNNDPSLRTVSIPSVTDIGGYAFRLCPATVEVTFGPLTGTVTESAFSAWTFYDTDGTTVLAKTPANLANSTFRGTASMLVKIQEEIE